MVGFLPNPSWADIRQAAESRLHAGGYAPLRDVRCDFECGVLRLRGRLPSQYLKQVAQALVVDLDGVSTVENQITVVASNPGGRSHFQEQAVAAPDAHPEGW
jgi:osmotically-inducible protein OsmY